MLFVIVGFLLLFSIYFLLSTFYSLLPLLPFYGRKTLDASEFDGFVRIFRLMLRLLFTVGTVYCGAYTLFICLLSAF